ncbi:XRE family transcriptional regulator [Cnuibacter physcomitrellae]|uniref:helix-turn-helix domain-containing protein n=1 Tax=Cnuibacter physcomitrellae TaxID=1619308 RepID=UPI002175BDF9|nr:XRE family transcriptional regulator [Cnuibacter physcomitrellae]MCS5495898.1 XRE family transcriptional regulator [Cnuibacter physcomitrellae]
MSLPDQQSTPDARPREHPAHGPQTSSVDAAGAGERIRAARRQQSLTLADLSERSGISVSTLSRLESGKRRLTLEMLVDIAEALGVPLDDLITRSRATDPRVRGRSFAVGDKTFMPLSRRSGPLQAYKEVLPPVHPDYVPTQSTHEGWDWIYVLSGRVRVLLGDQDVILEPGEAAEFDTRVPHAVLNPGPGTPEIINLFSTAGERFHLRASTSPR